MSTLAERLSPGAGGANFVLGVAVEDCSDALKVLLDRDDIVGRRIEALSPALQPDGTPSAHAFAARLSAVRAGLAQSFEWRLQRRGGGAIDVLMTLEPPDGKSVRGSVRLMHVDGVLDPLAVSGPLRQIVDAAPAVIFVKDIEGRYLFVNRPFCELFGKSYGEVIGRRDAEIFPPHQAEQFARNDRKILRGDRSIEFEENVELQDGERTYLSQKFPLHGDDGTQFAVCGISTDITQRKRSDDILRNIALGVSAASGEEVFPALLNYLAHTLGVDYAFIGLLTDDGESVETLSLLADGEIKPAIRYEIGGTPCELVIGRDFRFFEQEVADRFPDTMLKELSVEGYAGYPLADSTGKPLGVLSVMHRERLADRELFHSMLRIFAVRAATEVERTLADKARRVSEESYRAIFEASESAIFVHDIETGAIVDVNPKACSAYGYTREEMLSLDIGALSSGEPPYTGDTAMEYVRKAIDGEPQRLIWHRRNRDGRLRWDEVFVKRATIGGVDRVVAITHDITELKNAQDALRASVEAAMDCVIGMDARGQVVEFNPAAVACFGYPREEVIGRQLSELIIPERYRAAHKAGMERYLKKGAGPFVGRRVEIEAMRADGSEFPAELAIDVSQRPDGPIFIGYLRDITDLKRADDERARLEAQLRQAQKMEAIGHLSGGIAHDFNNILTSIMGYLVLAEQRQAQFGDAKMADYLGRAQRSSEKARDLIQQMLTFSRGQRGERRALALAPIVKESVKLLRSTFPSTIAFRTELDPDVPSAMLDPVQLEQVLMNLCINARDAMAGPGVLTVAVKGNACADEVCTACRQTVRGHYVELAVGDTGVGISGDHLDRIFEPFFTTKEVGKGSGMGLSTVHGIVHEHGGHVVVDTAPGEGARFRVLLPAIEGAAPAHVARAEGEAGAGAEPRLAGRVMIVDDEPDVAAFMRELLEVWGLDVTVLHSGSEALRVFVIDTEQFDLVITDQTMPGLTGTEFAGELLRLRPDLPVVLYTGYSEQVNEETARRAGLCAVLRKPLDVPRLQELVQQILER
jgi:PAS domain S-box-containing protein